MFALGDRLLCTISGFRFEVTDLDEAAARIQLRELATGGRTRWWPLNLVQDQMTWVTSEGADHEPHHEE